MVLVPDERIESLVRALLLCLEHAGGVPLKIVFDNPKTVVIGRDEHGQPIGNTTLAQVVIDYGFASSSAPHEPRIRRRRAKRRGLGGKSRFSVHAVSPMQNRI